MKIKVFIALTFSILGAWLASAYVYNVDMSTYPRLGKGSLPLLGDRSTQTEAEVVSESDSTDIAAE